MTLYFYSGMGIAHLVDRVDDTGVTALCGNHFTRVTPTLDTTRTMPDPVERCGNCWRTPPEDARP